MKSSMFRVPALIAWMAFSSTACAQTTPVTWSTDWPTYVREVSKIISAESPSSGAGELEFVGKQVEWSGTVRIIRRPSPEEANAVVNVSLPELPISMGAFGSGKVNQIGLRPQPDEWKSWDNVSVGDKVVFRATLADGIGGGNPTMERAAKVGVMIAILNGNATPLISADGGTLVRKIP